MVPDYRRLYVSPSVGEKIDAEAKARGLSSSELLAQLIETIFTDGLCAAVLDHDYDDLPDPERS